MYEDACINTVYDNRQLEMMPIHNNERDRLGILRHIIDMDPLSLLKTVCMMSQLCKMSKFQRSAEHCAYC